MPLNDALGYISLGGSGGLRARQVRSSWRHFVPRLQPFSLFRLNLCVYALYRRSLYSATTRQAYCRQTPERLNALTPPTRLAGRFRPITQQRLSTTKIRQNPPLSSSNAIGPPALDSLFRLSRRHRPSRHHRCLFTESVLVVRWQD